MVAQHLGSEFLRGMVRLSVRLLLLSELCYELFLNQYLLTLLPILPRIVRELLWVDNIERVISLLTALLEARSTRWVSSSRLPTLHILWY